MLPIPSSNSSFESPFSSLRALQFHSLARLFRAEPDEAASSSSGWFGQWKLLIYDDVCQSILSPLFSVSELRRLGVTLHLNINAARDRVPDVPAIYFLHPTAENLAKLSADVVRGLYDDYRVHFDTAIPRSLLENLAESTSASTGSSRISLIRDEYAQFICVEDSLFTLGHRNSFAELNDPTIAEAELFAIIDSIVDSLFSVSVSLGSVPVIRYRPGNAAEIVATRLDQRLRDHLANRNNLFSSNSAGGFYHRPLLVLLDRAFDSATPLHHPWTYQALLNDLLELKSNRISIQVESQGDSGKPATKVYDLISSEDRFWRENRGSPFPKVAESVQTKLENYQTEVALINKKPGSAGVVADSDGSSDLASAISALPKLQKKKRMLDQHVNIATALLKVIKAREIDCFFEIEQGFLAKNALSQSELMKLIGSDKENPKGEPKDRIRALCIWFLQQEEIPDENSVENIKSAIKKHADPESARLLDAIEFLRQFRFLHRLTAGQSKTARANQQKVEESTAGWSMIGKFAEKMVTQGAGVLAGVRNLIPTNEELPVTRVLESIINRPESEEALSFAYLDPKSNRKTPSQARPNGTASTKEAVVFILGGGSYCEFERVQEFQRKHAASGLQNCIFGCTELVSPDQFLSQLAKLGEKLKKTTGGLAVD